MKFSNTIKTVLKIYQNRSYAIKIEITTVYGLILLPPLSFTEYSQLENFRFGANVGM